MDNERDINATASHGSSSVNVTTIISDNTAKWLVIVFLSFACAYSVVRSESAVSQASHAQQEADLAKYYTIDMETYLYKQGIAPPADPWRAHKPKGNTP